jgi:hypothetical protein
MKKHLLFTSFIAILFMSFIVSASPGLDMMQAYLKKLGDKKVSLFFLQQADVATIKPLRKSCYFIQLTGLKPGLLYFSDAPERIAGHMTEKEFVGVWKSNKTSPNVVMHAYNSPNDNTKPLSVVLKFTNPNYNVSTKTISYQGCINDAQQQQQSINATRLYNVSLFIDPFCLYCGG